MWTQIITFVSVFSVICFKKSFSNSISKVHKSSPKWRSHELEKHLHFFEGEKKSTGRFRQVLVFPTVFGRRD